MQQCQGGRNRRASSRRWSCKALAVCRMSHAECKLVALHSARSIGYHLIASTVCASSVASATTALRTGATCTTLSMRDALAIASPCGSEIQLGTTWHAPLQMCRHTGVRSVASPLTKLHVRFTCTSHVCVAWITKPLCVAGLRDGSTRVPLFAGHVTAV